MFVDNDGSLVGKDDGLGEGLNDGFAVGRLDLITFFFTGDPVGHVDGCDVGERIGCLDG